MRTGAAYCLAVILMVAVVMMFVSRVWINPNLFQSALFLLGACWAIALVVRPFQVRVSFPMIPLAGAVFWGLVQLVAGWTIGRADTRVAILVWVGNLVAFCLAMQVGRRILNALLCFGFVISLVSVLQYFGGESKIFWLFPTNDGPVLGPFVNRDQYAAFIEMLLPLALLYALGGGSRAAGFAAVSAAMYASVIAGASRAGALLVTAEVVLVPLTLWFRRRPGFADRRTGTINVWLLALVFGAVVGWGVLWNRFQDPDPFGGRREILSGTVGMIHAQPWTGFGLGTFRTAYPAYASVDFGAVVQHAHNDWAEWAADGGIPFLLLMLSIVAWSVPRAFRSVWGIGIVAVFVHATVDFPLQKPVLELWLFVLLGVLASETAPCGEARDIRRVSERAA